MFLANPKFGLLIQQQICTKQDIIFQTDFINQDSELVVYNFMSQSQVDKYKKVLVRKCFAAVCLPSEQNRYELLIKNIKSSKDAVSFKDYQSQEAKAFIKENIQMIEDLQKVDRVGQMLIELEDLFFKTIDNQEIYEPRKNLSFQKVLEIILKKRQAIKFEDIDSSQYGPKTKTLLKNLFRKNQDFKKWCQKYSNTYDITSVSMQIEYPTKDNNLANQQVKIQQHDYSQLINISKQRQNQAEMKEQMKRKLKKKFKRRIQDLEAKYPKCEIGQIKLLKFQVEILNNSTLKLSKIQQQLKKCDSFDPHTKLLFQHIYGGHREYRLDGIQGYRRIQDIYKTLLPIDILQLSARIKDSQFKSKSNKALFVIGNTGVGKSTLIQHLLGYQHQEEKSKTGYIIQLIGQLKEQHKSLETSDFTQSVTTHLSLYKSRINSQQIDIIDTPGFEDTNGPLVDIANQVSLERAYKNCKNCCYLLLLNPNKFNLQRSKYIKKIATQISSRFEYETLQQLASFCLLLFNDKQGQFKKSDIVQLKPIFSQLSNPSLPKEQIALNHIRLSLANPSNFFNPAKNQNNIKQRVSSLKFSACRTMKSDFESKTTNAIKLCCEMLLNRIRQNENKNEITKLRFYYQLVYELHSIIPKKTQATKNSADKIFIVQSSALYDKVSRILKRKIHNPTYDQEQFKQIQRLAYQLTALNQLADVNSQIKSQKDLEAFVKQYGAKLREMVNQHEELSKIKDLCSFILKFQQIFCKYLPFFLHPIEEYCFSFLKKVQKQLQLIFQKRQINSFDQNIQKYQKIRLFYTNFEQNTQIFKRQQSLPSKETILSTYIQRIAQQQKQILRCSSEIIQSFQKKDTNPVNVIHVFQNHLQKYVRLGESTTLAYKDNIQAFQRGLKDGFANKYDQIQHRFVNYFESVQSKQSKGDLHLASIRLVQVMQTFTISEFKEQIDEKLKKILQLHERIEAQTTQKIEELYSCLIEKKEYKKEDGGFLLKKIEDLAFFKKNFKTQNASKLLQQYKKLKQKIEQCWQNIENSINSNENYGQCLRLLKNSASISRIVQQFSQKHKKLEEKVISKLIEENKKTQQKFASLKVDTLENLRKSFSVNTFKSLETYISNIFKPIQQLGYAKQSNQLKTMLLNTYQKVSDLFLAVEQVINQNKSINFPSDPSSKHLKSQQASQKSFQVKVYYNYVCSIAHIYSIIVKYILKSTILKEYLEDEYKNQQKNITIQEMMKMIRSIFDRNVSNIKDTESGLSALKINLQLLTEILKECEAWRILQRQLHSQLQDDKKINMQMPLIIKSIRQKQIKIEGKQVSLIKMLFDSDFRINDVVKLWNLYFDLKKNADNQLSEESSQNFSQLQQNIQTYLNKINRFLNTSYTFALKQTKGIDNEFIDLFFQLIHLYQELKSKLQALSVQYRQQTNILKKIKDLLLIMFQEIIKQFKTTKDMAEIQIQKGWHYEAKQHLKRLQKLLTFILKFRQVKVKNEDHIQDQHQNQTGQKQVIKDLTNKINQIIEKEKMILQKDAFQRNDLQSISKILKKQGADNIKSIQNRKLREYIQRQLENCLQASLELKQQKILQFQNVICQLPLKSMQDLRVEERIKLAKEKVKQEYRSFVQKLTRLNLNRQSDREQLIRGFESLKKPQDKKIILDSLKVFYQQKIQNIIFNKSISANEKINLYVNQVQSSYLLLKNELLPIVTGIQEKFLKELLQTIKKRCSSFIDLLQQKTPSKVNGLSVILEQIFIISKFSREKESTYYKKQYFKQIKGVFGQFKEKFMLFQKYCPIRSYQLETNKYQKLRMFKMIMHKIDLYSQLLSFKRVYSFNNKMQEQSALKIDPQRMNNGEDKQIQQENDQFGDIIEKIESFQATIKLNIRNADDFLSKFSFQPDQTQSDDLQKTVRQKITSLQLYMNQLERIVAYSDENPNFLMITKQEVKKLKLDLKKKFFKFIQDKNNQLNHIVNELEAFQQIGLNYLQLLLKSVAQNEITFLQMESGPESQKKLTGLQYHKGEIIKLKSVLVQSIISKVDKLNTCDINKILSTKKRKLDPIYMFQLKICLFLVYRFFHSIT